MRELIENDDDIVHYHGGGYKMETIESENIANTNIYLYMPKDREERGLARIFPYWA